MKRRCLNTKGCAQAGKSWPEKLSPRCRCEMTDTSPCPRCSHQQGTLVQVRNSPCPDPLWTTCRTAITATLNTSPARQELSNSKPDQSLLSPSAAMTGLNPKCILHTQSSSLIFTATCFNSSVSKCARQTGTQESASALKIISRPSSASVDNQIY